MTERNTPLLIENIWRKLLQQCRWIFTAQLKQTLDSKAMYLKPGTLSQVLLQSATSVSFKSIFNCSLFTWWQRCSWSSVCQVLLPSPQARSAHPGSLSLYHRLHSPLPWPVVKTHKKWVSKRLIVTNWWHICAQYSGLLTFNLFFFEYFIWIILKC